MPRMLTAMKIIVLVFLFSSDVIAGDWIPNTGGEFYSFTDSGDTVAIDYTGSQFVFLNATTSYTISGGQAAINAAYSANSNGWSTVYSWAQDFAVSGGTDGHTFITLYDPSMGTPSGGSQTALDIIGNVARLMVTIFSLVLPIGLIIGLTLWAYKLERKGVI